VTLLTKGPQWVCGPLKKGDKIMSRDPKWAVLWRCWKKPFSGAAANSNQVQIIYLDSCLGGIAHLYVSPGRYDYSFAVCVFIGHRAQLRRGTHTERCCTVSHSEPLLFASHTTLSVDLRWLLFVYQCDFFFTSAFPLLQNNYLYCLLLSFFGPRSQWHALAKCKGSLLLRGRTEEEEEEE